MNHPYAKATLETAAETGEHNAPIHEAEGQHTQAALSRAVAADCRAAIAELDAAPAPVGPDTVCT